MWDAFRQQMRQILPGIYSDLLDAMNSVQYPSIRYNLSKKNQGNFKGSVIPWEKNAVQLNESPPFYLDPNWHAGAYYVQESSSMFLGHVIRQLINRNEYAVNGLKILDLCAAPGGKSTLILDVIPENALLVSNEILPKRNAILRENLIRWGKPNMIITQNDADDFSELENYFDIVVIDAPCSGEGLFRKDKDAIKEWNTENIRMCARRQQDILRSVISCVRENGYIVYSTCTFEPAENEDQIKWLLEHGFESVSFDITSFPEITAGSIPNTYHFYPHKTAGSGFFIACLKKVRSSKCKVQSETSKRKPSLSVNEIKNTEIENWIEDTANYSILQTPYAIHVFPRSLVNELYYLNQHLHITYFGIEAGELKKDIFIPAHALALSLLVKKDFPSIEVDKENALLFLRRTPLLISPQGETLGWKVIKYDGLNLGWVKVLKDRINNYLPNNWRILH